MHPKDIVREGYDRVSRAYRGDQVDMADPGMAQYAAWVGELLGLLHLPADVLDLGCGNGLPASRLLVEAGCRVTGVDISPVQIERARQLIPAAQFLCGDMTRLQFEPGRFDAVLSLYAVIHVPLDEQPGLFARILDWLKPGGYLLVTVGAAAWTGTEEDWLEVAGARMYWSHADPGTYENWLAGLGYEILWTRDVPEGPGGHALILARRRLP